MPHRGQPEKAIEQLRRIKVLWHKVTTNGSECCCFAECQPWGSPDAEFCPLQTSENACLVSELARILGA